MRAVAILSILVTGCVRDPLPAVCPDLAAGDLAVSEIRKASTSDSLASWVELYNTTGGALDLRGLVLRFRNPDGASETDVTVRRSLAVGAGGYVVLGLTTDDDANRPAYVDYGFLDDFGATFPSAAALDVEACATLVDRVQYSALPSTGTYSLGTMPPDANANDFTTNWCTDVTLAGTPQHANIACP